MFQYASPYVKLNIISGVGVFQTSRKDHDGMVMPIDEVDPIYSKTLDFIREALTSQS